MEIVAVVGVGLIGGSFALALRKAGFPGRILGVSSARTLRQALDRGLIDEGCELAPALARADLVYLSQPIGRILELLPALDGLVRPGALITDAGSTKQRIVKLALETVRSARFVGGHPLAGKESRGVEAADAELFRDRTYFLTPLDQAHLNEPAVTEFVGWLRRIGARPILVSAADHDRMVAATSHLAQLASTALAGTVSDLLKTDEAAHAAGPGLADMTRLALSPYAIWNDILVTNAAEIDRALAAYIAALEQIRQRLGAGDARAEFERAVRAAARWRL